MHEVAAGIAAEYFNETSQSGKALALVTAGPGLTNIVTAIAGAFLESRELLVIGGQVKTADLARGGLRQRGIQELDGAAIVRPISLRSDLVDEPWSFARFAQAVRVGRSARNGPVFLEIPLDIQARQVTFSPDYLEKPEEVHPKGISASDFERVVRLIRDSDRPLLLLGGGISRKSARNGYDRFREMGVPIATTWNGADRIDASHPCYAGRPNTWGQRSANLILQQADLLVALGTRLGMQQTGFNWQQFVPTGKIVQVDIDPAELMKGHPHVDFPLCGDANDFLQRLICEDLGNHEEWVSYARMVRNTIPLVEPVNKTGDRYVSPYLFAKKISSLCGENDVIVPCSSGSAFTVMMQTFEQKVGQFVVTNKGLASMGYGLSGAIGAAFANPDRRVVLVEGDGGFAQNMQEIGTAAINRLNIKIFIFDDSGYASIRMTQRNYFAGRYIGCDRNTGLGLPDWERLFAAWDVRAMRIGPDFGSAPAFLQRFAEPGVSAFIVPVDLEQTYFPKITSRVTDSGAMESSPLHQMMPPLDESVYQQVGKYLPG